MILPLYLTTQESAKRHARMPALVEKDNRTVARANTKMDRL